VVVPPVNTTVNETTVEPPKNETVTPIKEPLPRVPQYGLDILTLVISITIILFVPLDAFLTHRHHNK